MPGTDWYFVYRCNILNFSCVVQNNLNTANPRQPAPAFLRVSIDQKRLAQYKAFARNVCVVDMLSADIRRA